MVSVSRCVRKRAAEGGGASKILYGDPSISSSTKIHLHLQNTSRGSRFAADFALEGEGFEPLVLRRAYLERRVLGELGRQSQQETFRANDTALLPPSYLDLGAELDDAVRRDAEKLGRPRRDACEAGIEALAPSCHPGPRARLDARTPDKKRKLIGVELDAGDFRPA